MDTLSAFFIGAGIAVAGFCIGIGVSMPADRYELLPTPRGTIVLDKLQGHAYQEPPLPMFREQP